MMTRLCELLAKERSELAEAKAVGLGKDPNYIEEDPTAIPRSLIPPFDWIGLLLKMHKKKWNWKQIPSNKISALSQIQGFVWRFYLLTLCTELCWRDHSHRPSEGCESRRQTSVRFPKMGVQGPFLAYFRVCLCGVSSHLNCAKCHSTQILISLVGSTVSWFGTCDSGEISC